MVFKWNVAFGAVLVGSERGEPSLDGSWFHLAKLYTFGVLARVQCWTDAQSSIVALLVDTVVDGTVHADAATFGAILQILVAFG